MRIKLLGTGAIPTKHLSSSAVVDGEILVDCPNGIVKAMRGMGIDPTIMRVCLITHFHADHFFDLPFLLLERLFAGSEQKLLILGPSGLEIKLEKLVELAYPGSWQKIKAKSNFETAEVVDQNSLTVGDHIVTPHRVEHGNIEAYGYTISSAGKTVGFTGDASACQGVEQIADSSDMMLADMTFEIGTEKHMGLDDIERLIEKHGDSCRILPTHMDDKSRASFANKHFTPPADGEEFEI